MKSLYIDKLNEIFNSEITSDEKKHELIRLLTNIENDSFLTEKEKDDIVDNIFNIPEVMQLELEALQKIKHREKIFLGVFSVTGLVSTTYFLLFTYSVITNSEFAKNFFANESDIPVIIEKILWEFMLSIVPICYDILTYNTLQEYLEHNRQINSYQRRLKNHHK